MIIYDTRDEIDPGGCRHGALQLGDPNRLAFLYVDRGELQRLSPFVQILHKQHRHIALGATAFRRGAVGRNPPDC